MTGSYFKLVLNTSWVGTFTKQDDVNKYITNMKLVHTDTQTKLPFVSNTIFPPNRKLKIKSMIAHMNIITTLPIDDAIVLGFSNVTENNTEVKDIYGDPTFPTSFVPFTCHIDTGTYPEPINIDFSQIPVNILSISGPTQNPCSDHSAVTTGERLPWCLLSVDHDTPICSGTDMSLHTFHRTISAGPNRSCPLPTEISWWIWLIIALVSLIVIIVIVVLIKKSKRIDKQFDIYGRRIYQ